MAPFPAGVAAMPRSPVLPTVAAAALFAACPVAHAQITGGLGGGLATPAGQGLGSGTAAGGGGSAGFGATDVGGAGGFGATTVGTDTGIGTNLQQQGAGFLGAGAGQTGFLGAGGSFAGGQSGLLGGAGFGTGGFGTGGFGTGGFGGTGFGGAGRVGPARSGGARGAGSDPRLSIGVPLRVRFAAPVRTPAVVGNAFLGRTARLSALAGAYGRPGLAGLRGAVGANGVATLSGDVPEADRRLAAALARIEPGVTDVRESFADSDLAPTLTPTPAPPPPAADSPLLLRTENVVPLRVLNP